MLRRRIYSILAFVWLVCITTLSLISFQQEVATKSRFPWARKILQLISSIPNIDKAVHFIFYFVLGGLLLQAFRRELFSQWSFIQNAVLTFVLCISLGVTIELLQAYATTYRSGDVKDAIANTIGTIVAILLTYAVLYIKKQKKFVFKKKLLS